MMTPAERIAARTVKTEAGCWLWLGSICTKGYGAISVDGRTSLVHRVMYEETSGPIPPDMVLDHTCHDPAVCTTGKNCLHRRCVNPDHLAVVTNAANLARQSPAFKAKCVNGHDLSGDNLGRNPKTGRRYCRTCNRAHHEAWIAAQPGVLVKAHRVRMWARANNLQVAVKGTLAASLVKAYNAAHPDAPYIGAVPVMDEQVAS